MVLKGVKLMIFLILSAVTFILMSIYTIVLVIHGLLHLLDCFPGLNRLVVAGWKGYLEFLFEVHR